MADAIDMGSVMGNFTAITGNSMLMVIVFLALIVGVILYNYYRTHRRCPFIPEMISFIYMKKVDRMRFKVVTVVYTKETPSGEIVVHRILRELMSAKDGLYLSLMDELISPEPSYLLPGAGDDDIIFYNMTGRGCGYPHKLAAFDFKVEGNEGHEVTMCEGKPVEDSTYGKQEKVIAFIKASHDTHEMFLPQHFEELANGIEERVNRGKSNLQRLLDSGMPALMFVAVIVCFILVFVYAGDAEKRANDQVMKASQIQVSAYANFVERDRYCQLMISKYAGTSELNYYSGLPSPLTNATTVQ